ncbi:MULTISPECIES: DNA-binding protein [unclassified Streptomyces]|uniref:DNA-binding protein n=1 Tax=unclassified Streptomyces TaxID=2593676 RepID=UPI0036467EA5
MIPHGRPAITEDDIATAQGLHIQTWRRREAAAFRAHVPVINPGDRLRLYDRDQAHAHLNGTPLPAPPPPGEHPDDLLTDREAGDVLDVSPHTIRAYASTGHLSTGLELYGRRWWPRHEINARRDAGDQRSTPRETAVRELAAQLGGHDSGGPTAAELAARDGISTRTARRRITAARQQLDATEQQQTS